MSSRRATICRTVPIAATLIALAAPAVVGANPLLSGYGGPGQGAQTIIGGGLVNTPGGGSGSAAAPTVSELTVGAGRSTTPAHRTATHPTSAHPPRKPGAAGANTAASGGAPAVRAAGETSAGSGGALGLSGGDVALILFVLAALTATAALTRQIARRTP